MQTASRSQQLSPSPPQHQVQVERGQQQPQRVAAAVVWSGLEARRARHPIPGPRLVEAAKKSQRHAERKKAAYLCVCSRTVSRFQCFASTASFFASCAAASLRICGCQRICDEWCYRNQRLSASENITTHTFWFSCGINSIFAHPLPCE